MGRSNSISYPLVGVSIRLPAKGKTIIGVLIARAWFRVPSRVEAHIRLMSRVQASRTQLIRLYSMKLDWYFFPCLAPPCPFHFSFTLLVVGFIQHLQLYKSETVQCPAKTPPRWKQRCLWVRDNRDSIRPSTIPMLTPSIEPPIASTATSAPSSVNQA